MNYKLNRGLLFVFFFMFSPFSAYGQEFTVPSVCQSSSQDFEHIKDCIKKHFIISGKPINPMIIKDLNAWISDSGDQIVSINLLDSQDSNKYFHAKNYEVKKHGEYFTLSLEIPSEDQKLSSAGSFSYVVEGVTDNGVFVLQTIENGGGTGYFQSLLFVRIREDMGFGKAQDDKLVLNQKRILIEKLGEMPLGDRVKVDVKVKGNTLVLNTEGRNGEKSTKKISLSLENK